MLPILASVFKDVGLKSVWYGFAAPPKEDCSLVCVRVTLICAMGVRQVILFFFLVDFGGSLRFGLSQCVITQRVD